MSVQLDALEAQVLNLGLIDRSHLLDCLVASIAADDAVQQAWQLEALERDVEIQTGQTKVVSGKDMLAQLAAKLQWHTRCIQKPRPGYKPLLIFTQKKAAKV